MPTEEDLIKIELLHNIIVDKGSIEVIDFTEPKMWIACARGKYSDNLYVVRGVRSELSVVILYKQFQAVVDWYNRRCKK